MTRTKIWFNNLIDTLGKGHRLKYNLCLHEYLQNTFPEHSDFHIIQVGANDGKSFDFLYSFLKKKHSKGVLIEPVKDYYDKLIENYSDCSELTLINMAVHPLLKEVEIFRVDKAKEKSLPDWARGIASLDAEHHKKSGISKDYISTEVVSCDTLMNLLTAHYKWRQVDLLQIDVEGFDFEVLDMFNFDWKRPKLIKYEFCNLTQVEYKASIHLLKKNHYCYFKEGNDIVAIDMS